ncbi:SDR family NAD(P)-dependent oxidoreductase [Rhodohalobacter halophilus]|uniref:SDR family NAD(P)-dependent oxidoreductase n=1 Tax=Rhodohalobacter halophilus TaxID=1812810 RepID=UPI00083F6350|nr:SDR family oxidoreductase [Rhodohalobacter halophilus]
MSKHIIITGASKGIGFETAKRLAQSGHRVTAIARSKDALLSLQKINPDLISVLRLDITSENAVSEISDHLKERQFRIDGFIHNAGVLINKPLSEQSRNDWQKQFEVNLMAPALLTAGLKPFFNERAHVLTISSMGGFQGSSKFPGLSAYSATKGGLAILTESMAAELSTLHIACNCLCLGAVQTEMLEQAFPGVEAPVSSDEMGEYVANFILTGHKFYNGQILPVTLGDPDA